MADIRIEVEVKGAGAPEIPIYTITVRDEKEEKGLGVWRESFGSKELAEAFLKGLEAAFSFTEVGFIKRPTIPTWRGWF